MRPLVTIRMLHNHCITQPPVAKEPMTQTCGLTFLYVLSCTRQFKNRHCAFVMFCVLVTLRMEYALFCFGNLVKCTVVGMAHMSE